MEGILKDTITIYNEYIYKLKEGCKVIMLNLREDRTADAFQLIIEFTQGLEWVEEVNRLLQLNEVIGYLDSEIIKLDLQEINNALVQQDYVLAADIFEYELEPFFSSFVAIEV